METFEYKMTKEMIQAILKARKDKRGSNQQYLCNYVNDHFGIMGTCVRVISY